MRRLLSILCLSLLATTAVAQNLFNVKQWKVADGGNDHWYGVYPVRLTWLEADTATHLLQPDFSLPEGVSRRGYLVSIGSQAENDFVRDSLVAQTTVSDLQIWLGAHDDGIQWSWSSGENFFFENWYYNEPNSFGGEKALTMWCNKWGTDFGEWNDSQIDDSISRGNTFWSIIEWGAADSSMTFPPLSIPPVYLLSQWKSSEGGNNHWYGVLALDLEQPEATDSIASLAIPSGVGPTGIPYLGTITSQREADYVYKHMLNIATGYSYWLGAIDSTSRWTWNNGEPFSFAPGGVFPPLSSIAPQALITGIKPEWADTIPSWSCWGMDWPSNAAANECYNGVCFGCTGCTFRRWSLVEWGNPFCGDVDNNQKVNVLDLTAFVKYLFGGGTLSKPENADASGDGALNVIDLSKVASYLFLSGGPLACAEW